MAKNDRINVLSASSRLGDSCTSEASTATGAIHPVAELHQRKEARSALPWNSKRTRRNFAGKIISEIVLIRWVPSLLLMSFWIC